MSLRSAKESANLVSKKMLIGAFHRYQMKCKSVSKKTPRYINGLQNVTFYHENLEEDVTKQPWAKNGFDKVLLDPARAGAAGVMQQIIKLEPIRIVYVSCNPATLARDSEALLKAGYTIARLAMLDMFPHTGHLESMVLFSRVK